MEPYKKQVLLVLGWFFVANLVAIFLTVHLILQSVNDKKDVLAYSVFASKPFLTATMSEEIVANDNRAAIIDHYFARYNCPLEGTGRAMVDSSDKYGFEFWWLPAIAWQESSCGKVMIPNSYNPFGYGIYGTTVTKFETYELAIDQVSRDLAKNYFAKGLTEPCEFEKRYTPPSKGRWCKAVTYFRDEMLSYSTE